MTPIPNVVNPGQSPTPPAPITPTPPGSPASPASATPGAVIPGAAQAPAIPGAKPPEGYVPITALHEEREKRQALDTRMQQLTAIFGDKFVIDAAGQVVPLQQTPASPVAPAQQDFAKQLEKLWEDDPKQAIRTEMQMALQWYDQVNSHLSFEKSSLRAKFSDFTKFESGVDQYLSKLPVEQRSRPGIAELAYLVVKGQNSDTTKQQAIDELIGRLQRGESVQGITGGTFTPPPNVPGSQPTTDQMNAAAAMGMTIQDYMKNVKV